MNLDKKGEAYKVVYKNILRRKGWESGSGILLKRKLRYYGK
jgi:hypothetical protein